MSGFSRWGEYKQALATGVMPEELQQAFENYVREYEIKFHVAGVSELENANKVLEGTASLIESLQKGGEIAIKAKLEFEGGLFDTAQQKNKLLNGSYQDQLETIKNITGLSNEQIQAMGFKEAKDYAQRMLTEREKITAESLNQAALAGFVEDAENMARVSGYVNIGGSMSRDEALDYINKYI